MDAILRGQPGSVAPVLRLWWEIARRGYARYAAYPGATFAGIWTNTIFGLLQAFILLALYDHRSDVGGWDETDTLTYVWLAQAMIATVYIFGWFDVAMRIRSGDVATDLARPLDPLRYWLAFDLGRAFYHFVFRGVPPFVFGLVVFDLDLPEDAATWLAFALSLTLAVVVSFAYRFLYNLAAFWLLDYRGIGVVAIVVSLLFSGMVMPLPFFPDWLEAIARVLPFAAFVQVPVDVFLGQASGADLATALLYQAVWAMALIGLAWAVLAAAVRSVVVQGG
jgi:ABC-2 type transport system permease protein